MTIGPKGQIVIPAALRKQLGLEPGQRVAVELHGPQLVLTPIPKDLIAYLGGSLKGSPSPLPDLIREHAEEVRRDAEGRV
jgi:AbrB family looped-hinge helix DNA binding protein